MKMVSLVLIVNLIFVLISLVLLSKIFNSEDILFGEKRNFKLIQSRSSIKEGSMPGISDGFMVYVLAFISLIYVSPILNLFGEKRNFKLIQSRSSIKEGSMPGISDGFMVYVLAFISLIYVSPILNMKLGIMGNTINQFIME